MLQKRELTALSGRGLQAFLTSNACVRADGGHAAQRAARLAFWQTKAAEPSVFNLLTICALALALALKLVFAAANNATAQQKYV